MSRIFHQKQNKPIQKGVAKTPVVMQLEALECGAAALAMILAYYGKWIPLEQVRLDCGISRDGSSAKNILLAARNYGLTAKGYRVEPEILKQSGTFPCIVHWEFNHFIVLNGFRNGKVYVNDPARGSIVLTEEQFDDGFTGICIMLEPTDGFEMSGKPKSILGFVKRRLKGAASAVAFSVITLVIASLMGVIKPGFARFFADELLGGGQGKLVIPFLVFLSLLAVIEILVSTLTAIYSLRISGKLAVVGNASYMWKVLRLPMVFFSQRMAGDIQQRKESNGTVAQTLVDVVTPLAINTVMMIFYLTVMVRYSVWLATIGILSIVINFLLARIISKRKVNVTRVLMRDSGMLYGTTVAGIEMIETIKSSGAENGFFENWAGYKANVNNGEVKYTIVDSYLGMIPSIISALTSSLILVLGIYFTVSGDFTIGMVMAFQGFLVAFSAPATELIAANSTITEMRTLMERIEDVMEYPDDTPDDTMDDVMPEGQEAENEEEYSKLSGDIEIKNVTFGYSPLGEPIIKDFSMKMWPGKKIAFVGATGCGKSTISKLISGLYKPWSGEILFDGKPIEEIPKQVLTGSLAVVDQDIILFEDTIADNIRMWDSTIQDFEVILAARDASIHNDILEKSGGYQHKILEGGKDFSGGQKQRMEIARVLAQDPTIIIMDEATSALDARTEYEVVKSIADRGITCIVIAHRLSTIRDCDEIVVLDKGVVVERGTHEELFAEGGYYTQLIDSE